MEKREREGKERDRTAWEKSCSGRQWPSEHGRMTEKRDGSRTKCGYGGKRTSHLSITDPHHAYDATDRKEGKDG